MARSRSGYGRGTGRPHPVDVHVGARVRMRRTLLGRTQTNLAESVGLTFQQVQKYERGINRIGAGRLYELSRVLDVPIDYFFEDMPPEIQASVLAKRHGAVKEPVEYEPDLMAKRQTLELVRAYYEIEDASVRKRVYELIKVAARL